MTEEHIPPPDPRRQSHWTAAALLDAEFPEPRWAVPGLLPTGAALLVGPPKIGKSWMTLGIAVAVASGGQALGKIDVDPGPVLVLALEDTPRRLKHRLTLLLGEESPPADLDLWTTCSRLDKDGITRIGDWLKQHPTARLVIIDVLARMRAPDSNGRIYDADYADMAQLKRLADRHDVAVVVVHHTRKAAAEDFIETVSASNGLAGAADTIMVLRRERGQADAVLQITGRDVEEGTYALQKAGERFGTWKLLDGPAIDYTLGETRAAILRYVRDHPASKPKQIAQGTGIDYERVKKTVQRMEKDGQLQVDANSRYTAGDSRDSGDSHDNVIPLHTPVPPVPGVPEQPARRRRRARRSPSSGTSGTVGTRCQECHHEAPPDVLVATGGLCVDCRRDPEVHRKHRERSR